MHGVSLNGQQVQTLRERERLYRTMGAQSEKREDRLTYFMASATLIEVFQVMGISIITQDEVDAAPYAGKRKEASGDGADASTQVLLNEPSSEDVRGQDGNGS